MAKRIAGGDHLSTKATTTSRGCCGSGAAVSMKSRAIANVSKALIERSERPFIGLLVDD